MKPKTAPALFVVWALTKPGPKWRQVTIEPKTRAQLVLDVRDQWALGRVAQIRPVPVAKVA